MPETNYFIRLDEESTKGTANLVFSSKPVSGRCLRLMQEAQAKYHFKRTSVGKYCGHLMEDSNAKWEQLTKMKATSQIEFDFNYPLKCKPNATKKCRVEYLGLLSILFSLADDEELRNCYDQSMPFDVNTRPNDFLIFTSFSEDEIYEGSTRMNEYLGATT